MQSAERNLAEPIVEPKIDWTKGFLKLQTKIEDIFMKKGVLFLLIGFLLGRALILTQLTPFSLPFFAAVYFIRRDWAPLALAGLVCGGATLGIIEGVYTLGSIFLFLILYRISVRWVKNEVKSLPLFVFGTILAGKMLKLVTFGNLTVYEGSMAAIEAGLGLILTSIFMQGIPLLAAGKRRPALKTEEIVCLIIMLASVMTGTMGWSFYEISVEHTLSRYLVLLFAFVGGATVGSTVGVVTGLIFSLASVSSMYHMSLLAFAGLLGGLLKEGGRLGASAGLMIATLLIGMYGETGGPLGGDLMESGIAVMLFLLTPVTLTSKIARHIPGTPEYAVEQQQYARKVRDVTARRVSQFSNVFEALSKSFSPDEVGADLDGSEKEMDFFLSNVTEKTCQTCFKKDHCWARNFNKTYDYMKDIMHEMDEQPGAVSPRLAKEWDKHCTKSKKVIDTIQEQLTYHQANRKLKRQVQESRRLVADQLLGVSEVMGDFAKEIQRERENHHKQEDQILSTLQEFGIQVEHVEIFSLDQGNVDIDITIPYCRGHGECEKLIAPMLSDIMGETILVSSEECASFPNGFCHATFRSAKAFVVTTGVAHAAKDGGLVSGDSYSTIELSGGKFAIAISDGMGNGERAHAESRETLLLLQQILQSGIEEKVAIKAVNSILSLRTTDEIFSTLDLAMIDLQNASGRFLKVGSTPSFIKRGNKIFKVQASNLPMGILQEFEVDVVSEQMKAGDLLIMMSDGVFEGPKHVENYDLWMKRKIQELQTDDPQAVADLIMEEVIRSRSGLIEDDMTVVAAKVDHNIPKWSSIPMNQEPMRA